MPKATAVWLVENTSLAFEQIADFCGMHILEVQGIADGEVSSGIIGKDPITSHQLTREEIERCEANPKAKLKLITATEVYIKDKKKQKTSRYTPVARRQDKPAAVAWILKHCPDVTDLQITRLIGTTKTTIAAIRNKTHWNYSNITGKDPVLLGLCSQNDLDTLMGTVKQNKEREEKKVADELARQDRAEKAKNEEKEAQKKAKKVS
jgi:hypothetical protein